ncbi:MAG: biopolymer transporter ExbD [Fimbriimonas sp.]|nr:biopolymer transporter ExbD [Fimbriimonas sp.]
MRKRVSIRRRKSVDEPEIIVIPMIDVMMFLLFFFMVASLAMVTQNAIPVTLPKASSSQDSNAQTITITIRANQSIYLNTSIVTIDRLEAGLEKLKVGPKNVITINADESVPHGLVIAAMDEARKAGVIAFGFATSRK